MEMLTVKEWAEKAGLKLFNYDGFVEMYERMSNNEKSDFETYVANRVRNAGDLLCSRRAFQAGLSRCTLRLPDLSQYEEMANVIPNFVESNLNIDIIMSIMYSGSEEKEPRKKVERLLEIIRLKKVVREKSIEINGITEEIDIADIDKKTMGHENLAILKRYTGTVESIEVKLIDEIISDLENLLQQGTINLSNIPNEKIKALASLFAISSRTKNSDPLENEYMYIDILGKEKEPYVQPYNVIEKDGIRSGVAFDLPSDNGRVRGAMRTTPEMDKKIKEKIGMQTDDVLFNQPNDKDETARSLEVIDSQVKNEERRGFMKRFEDFVKHIIESLRGNKGERE